MRRFIPRTFSPFGQCFLSIVFVTLQLSASLEILNNNTNYHVQHQKSTNQQERNEIQDFPGRKINYWLQKNHSIFQKVLHSIFQKLHHTEIVPLKSTASYSIYIAGSKFIWIQTLEWIFLQSICQKYKAFCIMQLGDQES